MSKEYLCQATKPLPDSRVWRPEQEGRARSPILVPAWRSEHAQYPIHISGEASSLAGNDNRDNCYIPPLVLKATLSFQATCCNTKQKQNSQIQLNDWGLALKLVNEQTSPKY